MRTGGARWQQLSAVGGGVGELFSADRLRGHCRRVRLRCSTTMMYRHHEHHEPEVRAAHLQAGLGSGHCRQTTAVPAVVPGLLLGAGFGFLWVLEQSLSSPEPK